MLDIKLLRSTPEVVRAGLESRGESTEPLDTAISLDASVRAISGQRDEMRSEINGLSKQVGELHRAGRGDDAAELQTRSRELGQQESALADEAATLTQQLTDIMLVMPNVPSLDAPVGASEKENVVLRVHGFDDDPFAEHQLHLDWTPTGYAEHQLVPHWESAEELGILDVERATKMSGAMFVLYRGLGARLVRALIQLGLDRNSDAYEEMRPPSLVRTETLMATGQLPKFSDDAYHIERDDLWAIPTGEVPMTSVARDEILAEDDLPMRMMAHTSCFRREAGSAGRDTRGLLRVHEFDKVEILAYASPEQGNAMHEELLERAEGTIVALGLPYRILDIWTGDLGQPHARCWDIEVWAPGADRWLEVSSVSWFADYHARRGNIRYKPEEGKGTGFVHTVNGSAVAVPRVWAAIVEHNRQPDGSIAIPEALHPYMGGHTVIPAV